MVRDHRGISAQQVFFLTITLAQRVVQIKQLNVLFVHDRHVDLTPLSAGRRHPSEAGPLFLSLFVQSSIKRRHQHSESCQTMNYCLHFIERFVAAGKTMERNPGLKG